MSDDNITDEQAAFVAQADKVLKPYGEWINALAELVRESDRSCVLMVCAILDDLLEVLFRTKFRLTGNPSKTIADSLLDSAKMAPIGSFAIRSKLAYSLGMIPVGTLDALDAIRSFRNRFAHKWATAKLTDGHLDTTIEKLDDTTKTYLEGIQLFVNLLSEAFKGKEKYAEFFQKADPVALPIRFRFLALSGAVAVILVEAIHMLDKKYLEVEFSEVIELFKNYKSQFYTPKQ